MQPLRVQIIIFAVEIIYVFLPSAYYNNPRYLHSWLFIEFTRIVRVIVWYNQRSVRRPVVKIGSDGSCRWTSLQSLAFRGERANRTAPAHGLNRRCGGFFDYSIDVRIIISIIHFYRTTSNNEFRCYLCKLLSRENLNRF